MTSFILDQCTAGAFDGSVPFSETIKRATKDGVEWYSANLIFGMKTYYGVDLSYYQTKWPNWATPQIGDDFCAEKVSAAVRVSQAGAQTFQQFLERIADAGVVYYTVHLRGRKAIYFGRHGDSFTEPFPTQ